MRNIDEYQAQAPRTANAIIDLTDCCFGMIGETGEVVDTIKKHLYQGHPMDDKMRRKLTEELGDVMWYICVLALLCDIKMSDVLDGNVSKIKARYPDGFSTERSMNRPTDTEGL